MHFSADGRHFAYGKADLDGGPERFCVVVDGVAGPVFDNIGINIAIAPDGSDYAYMGYPEGKRAIVRGRGEPLSVENLHDNTLVFSPDGKKVAFLATREGKTEIRVNGEAAPSDVEIAGPAGARSIRFSPDSKRMAVAVQDTGYELHWIVDGKTGPAVKAMVDFDFSPDGAHYAYAFRDFENARMAVMVDGKVRATCEDAADGSSRAVVYGPVFLRDGTLEYLAKEEGKLMRFRVRGY
jgi:hypothetical protein